VSSSSSISAVRTPRETVEQLLHTYVHGARTDVADFYALDARIQNPWAADEASREFNDGREALRARFEMTAELLSFDAVRDVRIHETTDPEELVLELRFDVSVRATGAKHGIGFVWFLHIVDGLIVSSRDYSNPLESAELFKAVGLGS
jgi:ketosteroid isomerase-like protein